MVTFYIYFKFVKKNVYSYVYKHHIDLKQQLVLFVKLYSVRENRDQYEVVINKIHKTLQATLQSQFLIHKIENIKCFVILQGLDTFYNRRTIRLHSQFNQFNILKKILKNTIPIDGIIELSPISFNGCRNAIRRRRRVPGLKRC